MQFTRVSSFSGKTHTREIPVTQDQYDRWQKGALIQDAMPTIPKEDREFIMTGITPEEWKEMWSADEDGMGEF